MKTICDVLKVVVSALIHPLTKAIATVRDILISLSYFGWRPSVAYLSGKRRRVSSL